ncbi:hypothetical protein Moror_14396 [Moniliophthora roreri MCA 2997]|uniref:Tf2-1-like SH3-like domain-containing protein n=2 Tax=Moniliophthora roreri TaxID=221103 RepID=V2WLP7_MONRO|nr:hypothetical protein Moror_14396 [Moniliophthora roreri MCA 2997]
MTLHFTSGYHPEADRQTKQANQILEQYLQIYCTYQQDNWNVLLPLAGFAYNNAPNTSTGVSPFFTNKRYHPNITVHPEYHLASQKARNYVSNLNNVHQFLHDKIKAAQDAYKIMADNQRKPAPDFQVGQQVYILAKHIKMTQPTKKLLEKYLGPYTIIAQPSSNAFTIRLPDYLSSIHSIFHISQLEPFHPSEIPNCTEPPPPPVKIDDKGEPHYEISEILDSKLDQQYKEIQWVLAEDLDLGKALDDFHSNPSTQHKPSPLDKHKATLAQYSALWLIKP